MTGHKIQPGYLEWPRSVQRLRMQRYWYGHKGRPMTTGQRHRLKAEWCDDAPYDSRIRGGRVAVIATPVGTRREVVWRAVSKRWRRTRVFQLRMLSGMAKVTMGYDQLVSRFESLGEATKRTADTIEETLLAKVSRAEFYAEMEAVHRELRRADALAIAFFVGGIVMLAIAVALVVRS